MPRPHKRINFPKLVTVFGVTFCVALGACGLTALASKNGANYLDQLLLLGIVELAVMALSAAGLVLSVILWAISVATGN